MPKVESARHIKALLGEKYPKGKAKGVYPDQREVVTNEGGIVSVLNVGADLEIEEVVIREKGKMRGLVFGSGLTIEKRITERAEGKEHNQEVRDNPDFYNNEQP